RAVFARCIREAHCVLPSDIVQTSCAHLVTPRGWSQEYLAKKAGIDRTYVGGTERGKSKSSFEGADLQRASCLAMPASASARRKESRSCNRCIGAEKLKRLAG